MHRNRGEKHRYFRARNAATPHLTDQNSIPAQRGNGQEDDISVLYPSPPSRKVSDSKQNRPGHSLQPLVVRDTERTIPAQTKAKEVSQTIGRLLPLAMGLLSLGPLT